MCSFSVMHFLGREYISQRGFSEEEFTHTQAGCCLQVCFETRYKDSHCVLVTLKEVKGTKQQPFVFKTPLETFDITKREKWYQQKIGTQSHRAYMISIRKYKEKFLSIFSGKLVNDNLNGNAH